MRRTLAVAALAAALFTAAACGDDNGDDSGTDGTGTAAGSASTEEVCAATQAAGEPVAEEFQAAGLDLAAALTAGDDVGATTALAQLQDAGAKLAQTFRDNAASASDPALSAALEDVAAATEGLASGFADFDPTDIDSVPDLSAFEAAGSVVEEFCGDW